MQLVEISGCGADQPGIVKAVAEAASVISGNIIGSSMTLIHGYNWFAFMLLLPVEVPQSKLNHLESSLLKDLGPASNGVARVVVRELPPIPSDLVSKQNPRWRMTLHVSPDRPGALGEVAEFFHQYGANIVDLATRVFDRGSGPIGCISVDFTFYGMEPDTWQPLAILQRDLRMWAARRPGLTIQIDVEPADVPWER